MHIPTHVLSGWCLANVLPLNSRERFLCIAAASAADVDGLGLLWSGSAFLEYHHVIGHNLTFGVLLALGLSFFFQRRVLAFFLCLFLFHLHLLLDLLGSGEGWTISYFWPFRAQTFSLAWSWDFDAWQNYLCLGLLLLWTARILVKHQRSPLEYFWPYADRLFVRLAHPDFSWNRWIGLS